MKEHKLGQMIKKRNKHFIVTQDPYDKTLESAQWMHSSEGCKICGLFNEFKTCDGSGYCTRGSRKDKLNIYYKLATKEELLEYILLGKEIISV